MCVCVQGCKSTQSFDEVVEKKKRCPNCNLEYQYPIQWQKVARKFYGRQEEFEKVGKLEEEQEVDDGELMCLAYCRPCGR